jgi:transcription elongation factor GreA
VLGQIERYAPLLPIRRFAGYAPGPMVDTFPMTAAGLSSLRAQLKHIRGKERSKNVAEIEAALEHGDLKENAEYHAAKERQAALDGRMKYLEQRISRANVIDPMAMVGSDRVAFGATVTLVDMDSDEEKTYALVGEDEADADRGRISITSPLARGLVGKHAGDDAAIRLPKGVVEFEVVKIEYRTLD